jgi:hypothetical protein
VRYYPNSSPLFPVQGRRYVLAAVISVGEDKLPRRRTSQASRVSEPLERGTWSLRAACGLDRIRPNRVYDVSIVQPAAISTELQQFQDCAVSHLWLNSSALQLRYRGALQVRKGISSALSQVAVTAYRTSQNCVSDPVSASHEIGPSDGIHYQ